jgi:hypothetical protein
MKYDFDDTPILSTRWMELIDGFQVCPTEYTRSLVIDEMGAAILAHALKESSFEVEHSLGGPDALIAECRRFRRWLIRDDLPATFHVYRGHFNKEKADGGICWTTSLWQAETFAHYRMAFPDAKADPEACPTVVKRFATHEEALMALPEDVEDEIVLTRNPVLNPNI